MNARQDMLDKADAAAARGNQQLAELLRQRVSWIDRSDGAWEIAEIPRRADGAAERCECTETLCGCEPLRASRHDAEPELVEEGSLITFRGTPEQFERARARQPEIAARYDAAIARHKERHNDTMDPTEIARNEMLARHRAAATMKPGDRQDSGAQAESDAEQAARLAAYRRDMLSAAIARQQSDADSPEQARAEMIAERQRMASEKNTGGRQ